MKTALVLILSLFAAPVSATVLPLPTPGWVVPTMEAAPNHSGEKFALALWVLGWPCPDFDNQFAPKPTSYTPVIYNPVAFQPPNQWLPTKPSMPVPEPTTWLLMLIGFSSLLLGRRLTCGALRSA